MVKCLYKLPRLMLKLERLLVFLKVNSLLPLILGAEEPEDVKIRGSFYARLETQI